MKDPKDPKASGQDPLANDPAGQDPANPEGQDPNQNEIPDHIKEYFKTGVGRVQADVREALDGFKETLESMSNQGRQIPGQQTPFSQNVSPQQQVNEALAEKFYQGDLFGTLQLYDQIKSNQTQNLSKINETRLKKAFLNYRDKDGYQDLFPDMEKHAKDAMGKGFPPEAAAELGFQRARADFADNQRGGGENLSLMGGGMQRRGPKGPPKLPPEFQRIADKGIADGTFKDMDDYISCLNPVVKQQLGFAD